MAYDFWNNATVAAVVGGIVALGVSWFMTSRSEKRSRRYVAYQALEAIVEDLECLSAGYWRKSGSDEDAESRLKILLERIDVRTQSAALALGATGDELVRDVIDELTDLVTGGLFESVQRKSEKLRVFQIKRCCALLRKRLYVA